MSAGRPPKYDNNYIKQTREYIDSCEDVEEKVVITDGDKSTGYKLKLRVNIPTIEGLAVYLKVHRDTIYAWEKDHEAFSYILGDLRAKQARELLNKGLSGDYNPVIAKVLLTKHGYQDKQEIEQHVTGEIKYTGIEVVRPEVPPKSDT